MRLAALYAIARSGNIDNIETLRPLLSDSSLEVQKSAEMSINYFLDIGTRNPVPVDILIGTDMMNDVVASAQ